MSVCLFVCMWRPKGVHFFFFFTRLLKRRILDPPAPPQKKHFGVSWRLLVKELILILACNDTIKNKKNALYLFFFSGFRTHPFFFVDSIGANLVKSSVPNTVFFRRLWSVNRLYSLFGLILVSLCYWSHQNADHFHSKATQLPHYYKCILNHLRTRDLSRMLGP